VLYDPARRDELLDRLSRQLDRLGLVAPALLLLEAHRPLAFLAGQALRVASPLLGGEPVDGYADLLEDPAAVEALMQRLERADTLS
jgi:hypothetical protein